MSTRSDPGRLAPRGALAGVAALAVWALSACASAPPAAAEGPLRTGRLAVRVDAVADRPANQISASFELSGDARQGHLRMLSPLGTIVAEAAWAPGEASLRSSSEEASRYDSLAGLTQAIFGTELPIAAMFAWLEGQAWSPEPAVITPEGFSQLGWQVNTSALTTEGLLTAQREAAPRVNLRIRLDR